MKINTNGAIYIAKGKIYRPGTDGQVDVPDEVLKAETPVLFAALEAENPALKVKLEDATKKAGK